MGVGVYKTPGDPRSGYSARATVPAEMLAAVLSSKSLVIPEFTETSSIPPRGASDAHTLESKYPMVKFVGALDLDIGLARS